MTDKKKIERLFKKIGIKFVYEHPEVLTVDGGYSGFYFCITFDKDGKMTEYGSYE